MPRKMGRKKRLRFQNLKQHVSHQATWKQKICQKKKKQELIFFNFKISKCEELSQVYLQLYPAISHLLLFS